MTDYEGWTETEITDTEYRHTPTRKEGPHLRKVTIEAAGYGSERYYRLDPPAPKYREGEMRWITFTATGNRYLATRRASTWDNGMGLPLSRDIDAKEGGLYTLSDPVVVIPAPTDEEREDFLDSWPESPEDYDIPVNQYAAKIAAALRDQEARDA